MKSFALQAALAAAGVCAFSPVAVFAQTSSTAVAGAAELLLEEVTITGSRIITSGNDAPTPVTVITPEQILATKPTTLYENLTEMPVFSGSRGAANGPPEGGSTGQTGLSVLNLRNMGSDRNLVLLDGRRVPPVTADGSVDVGAIPQMLIQRVDIVTGGASAVYGSDAVTGVTNFIIDRNFNGLKVNLQRGVSQENDGKSYEIGIAAGMDLFGGRGHIEASYQRRSDDGLRSNERDWTEPRWTVQGNGGSIPWHLVANATNNTASWGGAIACQRGTGSAQGTLFASSCLLNGQPRPLVGQSFEQNGVLSPFDTGQRPASEGLLAAVSLGGDGVYFTEVSMRSEQHSDQGFLRFDYDLTDDLHTFVMGSWTKSNTWGSRGTQRTFPPGWGMGACNAYLAPQYQTALGCTPAMLANPLSNAANLTPPTFQLEKQFRQSDHYNIGQDSTVKPRNYYVLAGLEGSFGDGYRWDATYTHSESRMYIDNLNQNRKNIFAAMDAVVNPANGQIVCRVTLTHPNEYPGCVPVNMFGPTSISREAMEYMIPVVKNVTKNKLDGLSGSLVGEPLTGWAGPIGMALSAELRRLTMDLWSSARPDDFLTCNGLRFGNCSTTQPEHGGGVIPVVGVNQTVTEGAYEINMPLLKDMPAVSNLTFNGAARYTRYKNDPNDSSVVSRTFTATTWKTGIVWDVTDTLTLRWSRSRDIRAPSLYDLYQPTSTNNPGFITDYLLTDPLTGQKGVQVTATPSSGGNPLLDAETAHTSTVGIVWRPSPQFSVALDAYDIVLKDALYSLAGQNRPIQEACYASGGASPLCQLQERPNGFADTSFSNAMSVHHSRLVNIAEQSTTGIDLEAMFRTDLLNRPLTLRALTTYQPHLIRNIPFGARHDLAGVAYSNVGGTQPAPIWKASLFASYKLTDRLGLDLSQRYRSSLEFSSDPAHVSNGKVSSVTYTNITLSYDVPTPLQQVNVFLNIQNLFDKDPPPAGTLNTTFPGSFPGVYVTGDDVLGRYFTLGVRLRM